MSPITKIFSSLTLLTIAACTTIPSGPNILVLPGSGKSFEQFRTDEFDCRNYAQSQLGGATPGMAAEDSMARSAVLGAVAGAVVGALVDGGRGAAVGAGTGLALGGVSGAGAGQVSAHNLQRRYDFAYQQCMYARGNRVPAPPGYMRSDTQPSSGYAPTPPAGMPPPPPPR